jgi:voltage-gated potassium channel Kch
MIATECTPATLPVTSGGVDVCSLAEVNPPYTRVATALYFSAVTFTTVGYGDWHPVGWARFFAATEALSGITIMSAFTVILVRKIIR